MNELRGTVEVSAEMASAAILGMPPETCSCSFFYMVFVNAVLAYALSEMEKQPVNPATDDGSDDGWEDYVNFLGDLSQGDEAIDDDEEFHYEDPLGDYLDDVEPEIIEPNEDRI